MNVLGPRVHLRPTGHEDLPFLQALWNDGHVMRHLGYPDGMHVTDACMEQWWQMTPQAQSPDTRPSLLATPHCVIELLDGTLIGELSYGFDADRRARIDLKLATDFWGQGYATEALIIAMREIFATTSIARVLVEPSPANVAARHLLERCGFHPTPTENHPDRWQCTRVDFADRNRVYMAGAA